MTDETTMNTTSRPSQVVDERMIPIDDATAATEQVVAALTSLELTATATSSLVVGNSEASTDADNLVAPQADAFNEPTNRDIHPQNEVEQIDVATGQVVGAHDSMTATGTLPASSEGLTFLRRVETEPVVTVPPCFPTTAMASRVALANKNDVIARQNDAIEKLTAAASGDALVIANQNDTIETHRAIASKDALIIANQNLLIANQNDTIETDRTIASKDALIIANQNLLIANQNDTIETDRTIASKDALIIAAQNGAIETHRTIASKDALIIAAQNGAIETHRAIASVDALFIANLNDVIAQQDVVIEVLTAMASRDALVIAKQNDVFARQLKDAREKLQSARSLLCERVEEVGLIIQSEQEPVAQHQGADQET
jgi:hypothetical protein